MSSAFDGERLGPALLEGDTYKETSNSDLVVKRRVKLYGDRFVTFHDYDKDPRDSRSWLLASGCELRPKAASEIAPVKKWIRPKGAWTISATVGLTETAEIQLVGGVGVDWAMGRGGGARHTAMRWGRQLGPEGGTGRRQAGAGRHGEGPWGGPHGTGVR